MITLASTTLRQRALLASVLAAVLWSLGGVLIKSIDWHPMAIAGVRSAIAAGVLACLFRNLQLSLSRYQLGGALAYAATVSLFVIANKLTTAANVIFLQYTAPVYVALFSPWFLNERVTWRDMAIIALTVGGMGLFFLDELTVTGWWGNLAAIASGVAFAWTCLLVRKQDQATVEPLLLGNLLTALLGLPFILSSPAPSAVDWLALVGLGVFQLGLAYALFAYAMRQLPALEIVLILTIEPVLNPLWVMWALGERPGRWALVGGVIVIGSVTLKAALGARQQPPPVAAERSVDSF